MFIAIQTLRNYSHTLYNKNFLEYGQIAWNGTESMITDTEGHSTIFEIFNKNKDREASPF